ncbi:hypothetical protein GWC95_15825 [Sediminibacterium roseum]|uniref:Uncharacterized protein n=1 Tax=Sediminibacterium roseum TaxID=1978412 RepID=A0ABX0A1X5_9BACT|nr:hypothetical protein [Sediminibacterium roseum]NCI51398.1 hypothetical protein [Sediminibacterium roseum]
MEFLGQYKRPAEIREKPFWGESHKLMPHLDEIIYLSHIKTVPLPEEFLSQFRGISPYYDWLTNLEHFDYMKFDPMWLVNNDVSQLLKNAFRVPGLREAVRKYLRRLNHPKIARMFALYGGD